MSEDTERVTKLLNDIEVLVSDLFLGHRNFSPTEHCGRIQHALGEARHALATAEASAAAVGAQVREEAVKIVDGHGLPFPDAVQHGERINEMVAEMMASIRLISLPSGAEALAARDRATAERALREAIRSGLPWVEQDSLAGTLQRQSIWVQERLAALFPASGRTTMEGG